MADIVDPLNVPTYTKQVQTGETRTPVMGGNFGSFTSDLVTDYNYKPIYGTAVDTGRMGAKVAGNYLRNANNSITGMVDTARQGLGAATAGITAANEARIDNSAASARIAQDAASLRTFAPRLQNDANAQRANAATFAGMAGAAQEQAAPWLSQGQGILGLDAGAGGIAGEWAKNYNALSPDSLVSFAASDAQRSIENTRGQMARTLSRSGVSMSSGAYMAALGEAKKYEQALLSGVKTRARLLGLKEQGGALAQGLQMAMGATGMGDQLTRQALAAQQASSSATGAASATEGQAGGMFERAGNLEAQAGGLNNQSASVTIGANNALGNAYNSLASAQQVAADYYSTQASSTLGLLQSGANTALSALFS
jgi:hypothetical protein